MARAQPTRERSLIACLAGWRGRVLFMMDSMQMAGEVWAIDGCQEDCAKGMIELAGFTVSRHLRVTDCGLERVR